MDCRVISAFTRVFNALCPAMTTDTGSRQVGNSLATLRPIALRVKAMRDHFLEDAALDRGVGRRWGVPPPAILLHPPCRGQEAVGHRLEVCLGVVQAENEAAGSDPAERQPFGAQIVLQHP